MSLHNEFDLICLASKAVGEVLILGPMGDFLRYNIMDGCPIRAHNGQLEALVAQKPEISQGGNNP